MNPRPDQTEFVAVTPTLRTRLEATIENLLALLDTIDGEPDDEEGGDNEDGGDVEPNLGWTGEGRGTLGLDMTICDRDDEREVVSEDEGAACEDEGAPNCDSGLY